MTVVVLVKATAAFENINGEIRDHTVAERNSKKNQNYKNAYATMMYMGTPRDYEFYVATRVTLRSLSRHRVEADLVVIASFDVPIPWLQSLYVSFSILYIFLLISNY